MHFTLSCFLLTPTSPDTDSPGSALAQLHYRPSMSFNYPYSRHNPQDSWLMGSGEYSKSAAMGLPGSANSGTMMLENDQSPGFRNPWYSPSQLGQQLLAGSMNNLPQHLPQLSLLQQKKQPFNNQLQTTYENADQQLSSQQPTIYPPLRADNPFNHYYTNQEVLLHHMPDRRMSAAVDGPLYNPYNNAMHLHSSATTNSQLIPPGSAQNALPLPCQWPTIQLGDLQWRLAPILTSELRFNPGTSAE